ncbi:MAG: hypothetical protein Q9M43_12680 [Sulfurimonas sp.]|nr:hypothetical protein [Sulfurimonas sp.]
MNNINNIFNQLPDKQLDFLLEVYDETADNFARFSLGYYLCLIFDKNFTTFENSCYSELEQKELIETLQILSEKNTMNIIRLIDLSMALKEIKEQLSITDIDFNHNELMAALDELKNETADLKHETKKSNDEYLNIDEISELTKKSVDTLRIALYDQALLNPFVKKKKGTTITLKKKDIIKWMDSNFSVQK